MPKINIREIDNTGSETIEYLDYTVLVPGIYLEYTGDDSKTHVFEGVFTKTSDFDKIFTGQSAATLPSDFYEDTGFVIARQLVGKGLSVYYKGAYRYTSTSPVHSSSNSKAWITYLDDFGTTQTLTAETLFKEFKDRGKYDLRFITVGGLFDLAESDYITVANKAIECAGDRGDAVALIDVPAKGTVKIENTDKQVNLRSAKHIDMWVNQKFSATALTKISRTGVSWRAEDSAPETYGRYGAIFAPIISADIPVVYFKQVSGGYEKNYKTVTLTLPASFDYLCCFATQLRNSPEWFATAGSVRGISPLAKMTPTILLGDSDIDVLQVRSGDANADHIATDVITNIRPYGNIVWGNRTLHPLGKPAGLDEAAYQLVASSFLNIRQLCCTIKKTLYRAARRFTFDPNSDTLWQNFKNAITPTLEKMKSNQGIRGYKVIKVPTNKKALLVARIIISPIEAVEDFDLDVILSDSVEVTE